MGYGLHEGQLTAEQLELIDRFLGAFNTIEGRLRHELHEPSETPFTRLIDLYGDRQPVWREGSGYPLRIYADLRNALVHTRRENRHYLSVPLPYVVERIEQIRDNLHRPEKVIPAFQRRVITLYMQDPLSEALREINEHEYSQFPIYDEKSFCGLLTENGITRWLASHVANNLTLVDFDATTIGTVLLREETRSNYKFVARNRTVLDAVSMFSRQTLLEAVLITEDGKRDQELLGIITRWDVQKYLA